MGSIGPEDKSFAAAKTAREEDRIGVRGASEGAKTRRSGVHPPTPGRKLKEGEGEQGEEEAKE